MNGYVSEILARPKHYQSSWISTLAAAATDKTNTSVSTLHYKSCEIPCWLHLPGAGSFLCQLLHNCSELDDWCLVGDAHNLWCHLGLNEGLHPTTIFEPVSYYLKSSHLNMQSSNDDDKIISTWLLNWLKFWDLSWNAILVNAHVALFQGVLTLKNEVWKLKNWSHIFIDSAFINVHQQFC